MAKLTKEDIINSLKDMTILEINDLVKGIEEEFKVSASMAVAAGSSGAAQEEKKDTPTEVSLVLKNVGAQKVAVIKAVQSITGLGLMDSKKLIDTAPVTIKEKISTVEAEAFKKTLVDAGAEVEIK